MTSSVVPARPANGIPYGVLNWKFPVAVSPGRVLGLIGKSLSAILIAAAFLLLAISFRFTVDHGQDARIPVNTYSHFRGAICAVTSVQKYGTGRYVCSLAAHFDLLAAGLFDTNEGFAGIGKSVPDALEDTAFLNGALKKLFALPNRPDDHTVMSIGWGADVGYMDFVELAFRLFGHKVESLNLLFFVLMAISTALICFQFHDRHYVLFSIVAFHYVLAFCFLPWLDSFYLHTIANPRSLTILAAIPLLHAIFLIAYGVRPSARAVLLFLPQAAVMIVAGDFRAAAYWTVIAVAFVSVAVIAGALWRRNAPLRAAAIRCWPALIVFVCMAAGVLLQNAATDRRLAVIGGMRLHTFWQPLYYNLQNHPDWTSKYSQQYEGATGDNMTFVALRQYRQRHHINGEITHVSYERDIRAAFFEFVLNDPWFVVEVKYHNLVTIVQVIEQHVRGAWSSADRRFLILGLCVAIALVVQIRRRAESLSVLTGCTAGVVAVAILSAGPVWATVVLINGFTDILILSLTASFVAALWAVVALAVLISGVAAAQVASLRSRAAGWPIFRSVP